MLQHKHFLIGLLRRFVAAVAGPDPLRSGLPGPLSPVHVPTVPEVALTEGRYCQPELTEEAGRWLEVAKADEGATYPPLLEPPLRKSKVPGNPWDGLEERG